MDETEFLEHVYKCLENLHDLVMARNHIQLGVKLAYLNGTINGRLMALKHQPEKVDQ